MAGVVLVGTCSSSRRILLAWTSELRRWLALSNSNTHWSCRGPDYAWLIITVQLLRKSNFVDRGFTTWHRLGTVPVWIFSWSDSQLTQPARLLYSPHPAKLPTGGFLHSGHWQCIVYQKKTLPLGSSCSVDDHLFKQNLNKGTSMMIFGDTLSAMFMRNGIPSRLIASTKIMIAFFSIFWTTRLVSTELPLSLFRWDCDSIYIIRTLHLWPAKSR